MSCGLYISIKLIVTWTTLSTSTFTIAHTESANGRRNGSQHPWLIPCWLTIPLHDNRVSTFLDMSAVSDEPVPHRWGSLLSLP